MSVVAKAALAIALLAGGSGEPAGKKNFFLEDLADFRKNLLARGWQVETVAAQGGGKAAAKPASNAELESAARRLLARAQAGDRVLLLFHSHGLKQHADWGQKSHSITSEEADPSGAEPGFDLDRIEPGLREAAGRGVKTALIDLSCYSGATLTLRGPACTITLASKKYISLCSGRPEERLFASRFMKLPAPGTPVSLEAQFFEARRADLDSVNLPQISSRKTPALEAWDDFLEQVDPLDVFEDLESLRTGAKPFSAGRLLDSLKDVPDSFKDRLRKTLALREKLENAMPALTTDYDRQDLMFELPGGESLKISPASLTDLLDAAGQREEQPDDWNDVQRHRLEQVRPVRAALATRFRAQLESFRKRRKEFDRLSGELADEAGALMSAERHLYDERSEGVPGQSGCRDFSL